MPSTVKFRSLVVHYSLLHPENLLESWYLSLKSISCKLVTPYASLTSEDSMSTSTATTTAPQGRNLFTTLPPKTHLNIFSNLSATDLVSLQHTSAPFENLTLTHEAHLLRNFRETWCKTQLLRLNRHLEELSFQDLNIIDALIKWCSYTNLHRRWPNLNHQQTNTEIDRFLLHYLRCSMKDSWERMAVPSGW